MEWVRAKLIIDLSITTQIIKYQSQLPFELYYQYSSALTGALTTQGISPIDVSSKAVVQVPHFHTSQ